MKSIQDNKKRHIYTLVDRFLLRTKIQSNILSPLGARVGNEQNAKEILAGNNLLIVAPGGMKEMMKSSKHRYKLFWENRTGFVKLSVETGVPIVLAACPLADDIMKVHESKITHMAYNKFRFPLPFFTGLKGTPVPKKVNLTHYLSDRIHPPKEKIQIKTLKS